MADLARVGPHGYIHGWIKVGASGGLDEAIRRANAAKAKTGVLKRGQRQNMSIGAGLGVAGGSSDIERPIADALTKAARSGREHYVVPTAYGMAASPHKVTTSSGYIKVTPQGEVTDWRRGNSSEEHRHVATLSDHTVAAILERHLSKTQTYTPPAKVPKKDPDVVPRAAVARLIKDIQNTPALQKQQFYDRAREIAAKSGALDLIPPEWGKPRAKRGESIRYHQHALYVLRSREARERAGLAW